MVKPISGLVAFALLAVFSVYAMGADSHFTGVGKIVAVGDLHGDYEQYVRILKANDLVDDKLKWTGGKVHFVQLGDVTDRGPDSLKIIRHLMKLEKQAKRAGGRVHVLIGNHEAMNIRTDLRYVHPGEYSVLVTRRSPKNQSDYLELVYKSMLANEPEIADARDETLAKLATNFPLGYVEHRRLWEAGQELARWYAKKNTVIQINDTIFLHGGLDPHVETLPDFDEINDTISDELSKGGVANLSTNPRGPLWYRGLAMQPAELELPALENMLAHYEAKRIIIAHTTTQGAIMTRFDGRVIMADVGIAAHYGLSLANVVIDEGVVFTLHRGKQLRLPDDAGLKEYLERVAQLEPEKSRLRNYVKSLSSPPVIQAGADIVQ